MPSWKTHLIIAAIFWSVVVAILWQQNLFRDSLLICVSLPIALFYGILPDVDAQSGKANTIIEAVLAFAGIVLLLVWFFFKNSDLFLYAAIGIFVLLFAIQFLKHRGFIHSFAFGAVASAPFFLLSPYVFLIIFICFSSHLIADCEFKLF